MGVVSQPVLVQLCCMLASFASAPRFSFAAALYSRKAVYDGKDIFKLDLLPGSPLHDDAGEV